jgi:hypothetical protein
MKIDPAVAELLHASRIRIATTKLGSAIRKFTKSTIIGRDPIGDLMSA